MKLRIAKILLAICTVIFSLSGFTACGNNQDTTDPNAWREEYVGLYEFDRIIIKYGTFWGIGDFTDIVSPEDHLDAYKSVGGQYGGMAVKTQASSTAAQSWIRLDIDGTSQVSDYFGTDSLMTLNGEWEVFDGETTENDFLRIGNMHSGSTQYVSEYNGFANKEITMQVRLTGNSGWFNPNNTNKIYKFGGLVWLDNDYPTEECTENCAKGNIIAEHNHIATDFNGVEDPNEWFVMSPEIYYEFYAVYKIKES